MKKLITAILTLAMLLSCTSFAPMVLADSSAAEPVVLEWYYNHTYQEVNWGDDAISQEFTKRTGIALNMTRAKTGDSEQLNLMMASDALPEMVCVETSSPMRFRMRDSGMVMDFKPLIDQYAPEFFDLMGQSYWDFWKAPDEKNYFYANCTFTEKTLPKYLAVGPWNGTGLVRNDIYEALGRPLMDSPDKMIDVLMKVKEQYPDMTPLFLGNMTNFSMVSDYGNIGFYQRSFGVERFYDAPDGTIQVAYRNPAYLDMLKWLNKLFNNGIITREAFAYTQDQLDAIRDQGTAFCYENNATDVGRVPKGAPETYYAPIAPFTTMKMTQQVSMSWMSTFITNKCKNPEAAIKFLAYAASDEGDKLLQWGIEGRDWVYDANNQPTVPEEIVTRRQSDWSNYAKESGFRLYNFGINFADHIIEFNLMKQKPQLVEFYEMHKPYSYAKLYMMSLEPDAASEEAIILQQCDDFFKQQFPNIVMAANEEEVTKLFNDMVTALDGMGIQQVEKVWTANAQRTKDIFGENSISFGMQ